MAQHNDLVRESAASQGPPQPERAAWRKRLYTVIFESGTRAGRAFDLALIVAILASVVVVMLESVESIHSRYDRELWIAEWTFTILFTIEYVLRLVCARQPGAYAKSFFGIVDLLAIVPTYLSLVVPGTQYLLVIRLLRVLRVFRILKLVEYLGEADVLLRAMRASRRKITVFLFTVVNIAVIVGAVMYFVEGPENGFTSIPIGIYWAIVTLTTVGFGDVAPSTDLGRALAALLMIMGYGIIAVPTGIMTTELSRIDREDEAKRQARAQAECPACQATGHDTDASFCKRCGAPLDPEEVIERSQGAEAVPSGAGNSP